MSSPNKNNMKSILKTYNTNGKTDDMFSDFKENWIDKITWLYKVSLHLQKVEAVRTSKQPIMNVIWLDK